MQVVMPEVQKVFPELCSQTLQNYKRKDVYKVAFSYGENALLV